MDTSHHIGRFVRHVHIKDSADKLDERLPYTYVMCGEGRCHSLKPSKFCVPVNLPAVSGSNGKSWHTAHAIIAHGTGWPAESNGGFNHTSF